MLVFIDESGHPHPNDPNKRPVVAAICLSEANSHLISGRVHALKRDMLRDEKMELKARNLLNKRTYKRKPEYVGFVDELFSAILNPSFDSLCYDHAGSFP